jgi:outer membrane receptor protein involved in Fe transport
MRRQAIVGWVVVLFLMFGMCASTSLGQAVYGSISGAVTDPQGNAIAGAKVTVTNLGKGNVDEAETNENGNYTITHLIPDNYKVHIETPGFKAYDVASIRIDVDAVVRLDAQLQVGAVTQTVEVTGEVPQLKTDRSDVATTFSERTVESLPIYGRNFTNLQFLSPGNAIQTGFQHAASENPQGSVQINTQGQHFSGTAFELDGTDNEDPILGIIVINPNLDAIGEVKITSQNYDAEFGKAIGIVATTSTKSGTNEFHGSVFDYERSNTNFARNPFTESSGVAKGNWNEFGGTLGGPIVKNKLFIFGDYQGQRSHVGSSGLTRVPTATERTGDLSDLGINIYDPYQTSDAAHCNLVLTNGQPTPVKPNLRTTFPGNKIPACRLSAPAQSLLGLFSNVKPNTTGSTIFDNNYNASGSNVLDSDGFDIRSDYSVSTKVTAFGRYSLQKFTRSGPGLFGTALGGPNLPSDLGGFAGASSYKNQSVAGGFDYMLSPTLLTDFRFGYLRYHGTVSPGGAGTTPATAAGIPGLNTGSAFTSGMPYFQIHLPGGAPDFKFGYSLDVNQCNCPLLESEHQYQFVNNWTKIRGNHSFKFGADIRYAYNLRVPSDRHRAGQLEFNNDLTGNPTDSGSGAGLADFLLGYVSHFQRFVSSSTNAYETQPRLFFYGQDTWRVSNKLTLNYGLRWEIYRPESVAGNGLGGWVDTKTGEMRVAGQNGVNLQGNTETDYKHFSPRVGIAYQWNQKTVIRLGYGRSFDLGVFGTTFGHIVTQNLPVLAAQEYSGGSPGISQDNVTAFFLSNGPVPFDPAKGLTTNNCNTITDPTGTKTQCVGPNGRPMIPNGVSRDIRNFKNTLPTVDAWNVSVQRQLTPTLNLTVSYVGNKGTHTTGDGADYNLNQPTNQGYNPLCFDDPVTGLPVAACATLKAATTKQRTPFYGTSSAYPFPSVTPFGGNYGWTGGDRYQSADLNSKYNALQVQAEKRFSNGLSFQSSYTFQHAVSVNGGPEVGWARYNNINPGVTYGPNEDYRNHDFILTQVYELPFGKGKKWASNVGPAANAIVGGWSVNSATDFSSGLPWTPGLSSCSKSIDQGPCIADVVGSVKAGTRSGPPNTPGYWYQNTNGVKLGALGATAGPWGQTATLDAFGNGGGGINQFHGPKFFNANASLFKAFNLGEKFKAQAEFKFYNLFNHVNLDRPDRCVDCSTGGQITGLTQGAQMRRLEYGVKFTF